MKHARDIQFQYWNFLYDSKLNGLRPQWIAKCFVPFTTREIVPGGYLMKPLITAKSSKVPKKTSTTTALNLDSPAHHPSQNASPQWILLATPIAT